MVKLALLILLGATSAHAEVRAIIKADGNWNSGNKALDGELTKLFAADVAHPEVRGWMCNVTLATTIAVSWQCYGSQGTTLKINKVFQIANNKLVPADMWKPKSQDALEKDLRCPVDLSRPPMYLNVGGFGTFKRGSTTEACPMKWQVAMPYLVAPFDKLGTWAIAEAVRVENGPRQGIAGRWSVGDHDDVVDTQWSLAWASHDNGADITLQDALAYAKSYRGGGHDDWRLPTLGELESLVQPDLAHREPRDCTGGKSNYLITPLIHVSCGILWAHDPEQPNNAVGLISGNSRTGTSKDKTNYRALVVRTLTFDDGAR